MARSRTRRASQNDRRRRIDADEQQSWREETIETNSEEKNTSIFTETIFKSSRKTKRTVGVQNKKKA